MDLTPSVGLPLPRLSPAAATVLRRLGSALPAEVAWPGAALRLALEPEATAPAGWARCAGMVGEGCFALAADPVLLGAELASRWPQEALPELPPQLASILVEALLGPWLDRLEALLGKRPVLETMPGAAPPHVLGARDAEGVLRAVLRLDDPAARMLAAALPPADREGSDPPVPCLVLLDRVALSSEEWAAIAPGDVLLLDAAPAADGSWPVRLRAGPVAFRARLADGRLSIAAAVEAELDQPAGDARLDDLPLLLEAVIGEVTLPLSRVRELQPGAVLELGPEALRRVELRVSGRRVGEAELVMIGGRPGLRLLSAGEG
jgi:type III secretion protein Q